MKNLDEELIHLYKETASELTGYARRAFQVSDATMALLRFRPPERRLRHAQEWRS